MSTGQDNARPTKTSRERQEIKDKWVIYINYVPIRKITEILFSVWGDQAWGDGVPGKR